MALNPSNSINLEQLALNGLTRSTLLAIHEVYSNVTNIWTTSNVAIFRITRVRLCELNARIHTDSNLSISDFSWRCETENFDAFAAALFLQIVSDASAAVWVGASVYPLILLSVNALYICLCCFCICDDFRICRRCCGSQILLMHCRYSTLSVNVLVDMQAYLPRTILNTIGVARNFDGGSKHRRRRGVEWEEGVSPFSQQWGLWMGHAPSSENFYNFVTAEATILEHFSPFEEVWICNS